MDFQYHTLHPLEGGANVSVYLVGDLWESNQEKVLTLLPPRYHHPLEASDLAQIEHSFELRRSIHHPYLPRVLDLSFRGRRLGWVTERIRGSTFAEGYPPITLNETIECTFQLLFLTHLFHKHNFYFGFVSPSKLFWTTPRGIKFNVVFPGCFVSRDIRWVRYQAPEYLDGAEPSAPADIYSLGMLIYFLLSGTEPFTEPEPDILKLKQLSTFPVNLRTLNSDIPEYLERLVAAMVRKDPARRPSAQEAADEVFKHLKTSHLALPKRTAVAPNHLRAKRDIDGHLSKIRDPAEPHFLVLKGPTGIGKSYMSNRLLTEAKLRGNIAFRICHASGSAAFVPLLRWAEHSTGAHDQRAGTPDRAECCAPTCGSQVAENLKMLSRRAPLVLVVSDLHLIDEMAMKVYLQISQMRGSSISVIGEMRSSTRNECWAQLFSTLQTHNQVEVIEIPPLSKAGQRDFAQQLLGAGLSKELLEDIDRTCEGNPFFIKEYISDLKGKAVSFQLRESASPCGPLLNRAIPQSIAALLDSRLDGLSRESQSILEALSLFEQSATASFLAAVIDEKPFVVLQQIIELERRGLIETDGGFHDPLAGIKSPWVSRLARTRIDKARQAHLHFKLAEALVLRANAGKAPLNSEAISRHFIAAGLPEKCTEYAWDAICSLKLKGLYRQASDLLSAAVRSGALTTADSKVFRGHFELLYLSGRLDDCAREIEEVLRTLSGESPNRLFLTELHARILTNRGQYRRAVEVIHSVLDHQGGAPLSEAHAELAGDLLACLSRNRQPGNARKLAASILQRLKSDPPDQAYEKLSHALYLFFLENGHSDLALTWEHRSTRNTVRNDHRVRCAGRLFNLGVAERERGFWEKAANYTRHCSMIAEEVGNPELKLFAEIGHLTRLRKLGRHSEARAGLMNALEANSSAGNSTYIGAELEIELARNAIYQLDLDEARLRLDRVRDSKALREVDSTWLDSQLVKGWAMLCLGEAENALELVLSLGKLRRPRDSGRVLLLAAQARLDMLDLAGASRDAALALRFFPKSRPYGRAKTRLLQAKIAAVSEQDRFRGAYILDALLISKRHFYFPLLAMAHQLCAEWILSRDEFDKARAHANRALFLCQKIERPSLTASTYRTLAHVDAACGERSKARRQLMQAIQTYTRKRTQLPSRLRAGFSRKYIDPIQIETAQSRATVTSPPRDLLVEVREFAGLLKKRPDVEDLARDLLARTTRELSPISAILYLRSTRNGRFFMCATHGKCLSSGSEFLTSADPEIEKIIRVSKGDSAWKIAIPLISGSQRVGLVYAERLGSGFSESEFDFLKTLQLLTEVCLAGRESSEVRRHDFGEGLSIARGEKMIGRHPLMLAVFDQIRRVARSQATVLISGESGTGKELAAKAIHNLSDRSLQTFLPLNCAALPAELAGNELFGHEVGSYTGAAHAARGVFEAADRGTVFLDEISSMPLIQQAHLLRVLDSGRVRRIGSTTEKGINVRIIAATNQDLRQLVEANHFRRDLFHRLDVFRILLPPLRARTSDIPALCEYLLSRYNRERQNPLFFSEGAMKTLQAYPFPGNVRELKNLVERLHYTLQGGRIDTEDLLSILGAEGSPEQVGNDSTRLRRIVESMERGLTDFQESVKEPFLRRDLSRGDVQKILSMGLEACNGSYRKLVTYFGLSPSDYKRFMAFLAHHDCKIDFRPYRK